MTKEERALLFAVAATVAELADEAGLFSQSCDINRKINAAQGFEERYPEAARIGSVDDAK